MKLPPFFLRDPMEGDPPCHWANFLSPHLRRFPRSEEKIHWQKHLGHGGEGIVEAVTFGNDSERFALKLVRESFNELSIRLICSKFLS